MSQPITRRTVLKAAAAQCLVGLPGLLPSQAAAKSPPAGWVSGQTLSIDGGHSLF